ncbi:hypothetical protein [Rhizobium sp. 2MFCol3.1]|uniref:hypothetical protein n=1 Tax=Rhizobium sp. 2MFCol3.1 TaxID=1246459 RepID=UPI00055A8BE7|nr:hypothetical protein [Rhizobium sp. 2MFCol3.1]
MLKSSTKYRFNVVDRLIVDGREFRYHSTSKDGVLLQSDGAGPREVLGLTWKDVGDHLRSFRLAVQKDYYKLVKSGVLSTFSNDQVAYFRRHACSVFSVMRPTVRQVYLAMKADHYWSTELGRQTFELCSERTFQRLVDEMRRSAAETERAMARYAPMEEAQSD